MRGGGLTGEEGGGRGGRARARGQGEGHVGLKSWAAVRVRMGGSGGVMDRGSVQEL